MVDEGGAAFPALRSKGIFGRGKVWVDDYASSEEARAAKEGLTWKRKK